MMSAHLHSPSADDPNAAEAVALHLGDPSVHAAIERVLRRRSVPHGDIEDVRQTVLELACRARAWPPTPRELLAFVQKIARDEAHSYFRRRAVRAKVDDGPFENPDERAAFALGEDDVRHPIDARRQLDCVRRAVSAGQITPRQAAILARAAEGVRQAEIAKEMGLAYQTVRNELARARDTARSSWSFYLAAALFTVVCLLAWVLRDRQQARRPHDDPAPRPDTTQAPQPTIAEEPDPARAQGQDAKPARDRNDNPPQ